MLTRYSKIALVWAIALNTSLVVFNNLTDYDSNYWFVVHVLTMDTTFPDNQGMWRAINSSAFHHLLYWIIILVETATALLCWWGGREASPRQTSSPGLQSGQRHCSRRLDFGNHPLVYRFYHHRRRVVPDVAIRCLERESVSISFDRRLWNHASLPRQVRRRS